MLDLQKICWAEFLIVQGTVLWFVSLLQREEKRKEEEKEKERGKQKNNGRREKWRKSRRK
jgi:hypothetical protein